MDGIPGGETTQLTLFFFQGPCCMFPLFLRAYCRRDIYVVFRLSLGQAQVVFLSLLG